MIGLGPDVTITAKLKGWFGVVRHSIPTHGVQTCKCFACSVEFYRTLSLKTDLSEVKVLTIQLTSESSRVTNRLDSLRLVQVRIGLTRFPSPISPCFRPLAPSVATLRHTAVPIIDDGLSVVPCVSLTRQKHLKCPKWRVRESLLQKLPVK